MKCWILIDKYVVPFSLEKILKSFIWENNIWTYDLLFPVLNRIVWVSTKILRNLRWNLSSRFYWVLGLSCDWKHVWLKIAELNQFGKSESLSLSKLNIRCIRWIKFKKCCCCHLVLNKSQLFLFVVWWFVQYYICLIPYFF